jgi:hypothetical protein
MAAIGTMIPTSNAARDLVAPDHRVGLPYGDAANEVAGLAENLSVDVGPVLEGIGHDPRIGHAYLRPSYGFVGAMEPG